MAQAKFTSGSTMRHVARMTSAGGVGLMALFIVDALNLFYISLLGQRELAAAVGFAGTVQFFTISLAIGLSIAASAVVSRAVGAGDHAGARRLGASSMTLMVVATGAVVALVWFGRDWALGLLGATGETKLIASRFLAISLVGLPCMGVGMVAGGLLRAVGDARRAMYITLTGGIVAAVIDPLLIFAMGLGVDGAAIALVITRTVFGLVGLRMAVGVHDLVARIDPRSALADARHILSVGLPAVATQLSTPFGNAFLTGVVAAHGDAAVAGWAVVGRLTPLTFGVIFALSGAVGPILGQNRGARLWHRLRMAYRDALVFACLWVLTAWGTLWLATGIIIQGFGLVDEGASVLRAFTHIGAGGFLFTGALFVSNAAFNNLGRPTVSALFNWTRDAGVIPLLAWAIGTNAGASGVIWVQATAAIVVGSAAAVAGWRFVGHMSRQPLDVSVPGGHEAFALGGTGLGAQLVAEESRDEGASPLADGENTR